MSDDIEKLKRVLQTFDLFVQASDEAGWSGVDKCINLDAIRDKISFLECNENIYKEIRSLADNDSYKEIQKEYKDKVLLDIKRILEDYEQNRSYPVLFSMGKFKSDPHSYDISISILSLSDIKRGKEKCDE